MSEIHLVTGAYGFSGSRIAEQLFAAGCRVRTLTNSPPRGARSGEVEVFPLDFEDPAGIRRALEGVSVLYNTYWIRFHAAGFDQEAAVQNSELLFRLAREAGVRRIVHTSITNPSEASRWAYFRGKARLERALVESGVPHSVLRPAVLFGSGDILLNNIAWILRRFPVFGVFGDGRYRLRPMHVEDFARLAVREAAESGDRVVDAVGPESFEYGELVRFVAGCLGRRPWFVRISPGVGRIAARVLGGLVGDVLLTREEIGALMEGVLDTPGPATGGIGLREWVRENSAEIGREYASEVARRR